jgi:adenosylhomocysteinase
MKYDIKDISLAKKGKLRIEWASDNMPVLNLIRSRFQKDKPLAGISVAACLHVTTETAVLMLTLQAGGAKIALCASNPMSTQDDVAASLVKDYGISTFAIKGEDNKTYYKHIEAVLSSSPDMTMDDGADLVSVLHKKKGPMPIGGTEETTTGVIRLRAMENDNALKYPIIAVNDAQTKYMFDNRYGTGQSTLDGIIRATNKLIAGSYVVISGYGWCGRGAAMRAKGLGGNVVIVEVDPFKALEAVMDGFLVMPIAQAAKIGDIFITVTGNINVLRSEHFKVMKDKAIICNSGHFNVEIDIPGLKKLSKKSRMTRDLVEEVVMADGRRLYLLGDGRLINLAAAEGHPAQVMDMSFANQALSAEYMKKNCHKLQNKVYKVPVDIDKKIAELKLASMGVKIDRLTPEQVKYLASWEMGT